jgi:NitT/TauT family transport system permease protein
MKRNLVPKSIIVIISLTSMLIIWWLLSLVSMKAVFPSPVIVFSEVLGIIVSGEFANHMLRTTVRILAGFTCSMIISFIISLLMSTGKKLETFLETYILVGLTIPALAWSIISIMWLGLNDLAAIFAIVVLTVPMITLNIVQGIKNIDKQLLEMAEAFQATKKATFQKIILPQLFPYILSSSRYGLGLAWKTVVIVEMLGLTNGIGYMIAYWFGLFSMKRVIAWTFLFTLTMLLIEYGVLARMENRLMKWRPKITI